MSEAQVLYGPVLSAMRALHAVRDLLAVVMSEDRLTDADREQLAWLLSLALTRELFDGASVQEVRDTIAFIERRVEQESWSEFVPVDDCRSGGYRRSRTTPLGHVLGCLCDAMTLLDKRLVEVRCHLDAGEVFRQLGI